MNNKKSLIIILVLVISLISIGYFIYTSQVPSLQKNLSKTSPAPKYSAQVAVTIQGFVPATLLVKKGTQVTWLGVHQIHQIASDPHPLHNELPGLFESKPSSGSYSFTFNNVGTFTYHDEVSPLKFHGTVIVE